MEEFLSDVFVGFYGRASLSPGIVCPEQQQRARKTPLLFQLARNSPRPSLLPPFSVPFLTRPLELLFRHRPFLVHLVVVVWQKIRKSSNIIRNTMHAISETEICSSSVNDHVLHAMFN